MKVSIAGTGYVGLVSGVCLAELGHEVVCVDVLQEKVDKINAGIPPIYEAGLEDLLKRNIGNGRLQATTDMRAAVLGSELTIIAVGTPFDGERIDLKYIEAVAAEIGKVLADKSGYHTVVVKSTVVPGTTDDVVLPIVAQASGKTAGPDFGVGMNPEFLREGEAVGDFMNPDRIVYGANDERALAVIRELYAVFPDVPKVETNARTAEMIKYTANSLLATMISFSNEIANLCARAGVDVVDVTKGVHLDRRLSPVLADGTRVTPGFTTYIEAGCGFGGSCFPKDVKALISYGKAHAEPMRLLESVVEINREQPLRMLDLVRKHFPDLKGKTVSILGLSFKPGSDDMRESPAIPIVTELSRSGAIIRAYDPVAEHEAREVFRDIAIEYCQDLGSVIEGADAVLLVTRWPEFQGIESLLAEQADPPVVIDGRRMLDKSRFASYEGIGLNPG